MQHVDIKAIAARTLDRIERNTSCNTDATRAETACNNAASKHRDVLHTLALIDAACVQMRERGCGIDHGDQKYLNGLLARMSVDRIHDLLGRYEAVWKSAMHACDSPNGVRRENEGRRAANIWIRGWVENRQSGA
jgi:hypothetical protein